MRPAWILCATVLCIIAMGCSATEPALPPATESPPRGTYDPTSGCQRAMDRIVELSVKATGSGPTNEQRGEFLRRCVAAGTEPGCICIERLRRLPGRRGGTVKLAPAYRCLKRNRMK